MYGPGEYGDGCGGRGRETARHGAWGNPWIGVGGETRCDNERDVRGGCSVNAPGGKSNRLRTCPETNCRQDAVDLPGRERRHTRRDGPAKLAVVDA